MTTNKIVKNIRKIVDIDPNQSSLLSATNRDPLPGRRGIAYLQPGGEIGSISSLAGETIPSQVKSVGNKSSVNGQVTPTTGGQFDKNGRDTYAGLDYKGLLESVLNSDAKEVVSKLLGNTDNGIPDSAMTATDKLIEEMFATTNPELREITGMKDSTNSKDLVVRVDGELSPPTGWNSPTEGPDSTTYPSLYTFTPNYHYVWVDDGITTCTIASSIRGASLYHFLSQMSAAPDPGVLTDYIESITSVASACGVDGTAFEVTTNTPAFGSITRRFVRQTCSALATPNTCWIVNPLEWPQDDTVQLTLSPQGFKISPYENENDTLSEFETPKGTVNFIYDTNKTGRIQMTANGGFLLGQTDSIAGDYNNFVKVYGPDYRLKTVIQPSDIGIYLPK